MPADPGMNPSLFEPFDPTKVPREDLISTSETIQEFGVSEGWLYDRIWPRGALHRIDISGDRERYFVRSEIEFLRRPPASHPSGAVAMASTRESSVLLPPPAPHCLG